MRGLRALSGSFQMGFKALSGVLEEFSEVSEGIRGFREISRRFLKDFKMFRGISGVFFEGI